MSFIIKVLCVFMYLILKCEKLKRICWAKKNYNVVLQNPAKILDFWKSSTFMHQKPPFRGNTWKELGQIPHLEDERWRTFWKKSQAIFNVYHEYIQIHNVHYKGQSIYGCLLTSWFLSLSGAIIWHPQWGLSLLDFYRLSTQNRKLSFINVPVSKEHLLKVLLVLKIWLKNLWNQLCSPDCVRFLLYFDQNVYNWNILQLNVNRFCLQRLEEQKSFVNSSFSHTWTIRLPCDI